MNKVHLCDCIDIMKDKPDNYYDLAIVLGIKLISVKWNIYYKYIYGQIILDPDGWDRVNFDYSWYIEKITWREFINRAIRSSQIPIGAPE